MHTTARRPAPVSVTTDREQLRAIVADAVRIVRRSTTNLTPRQQRLLSDLARGRYLAGVFQFVEIMRSCTEPLDAAWFPERLRGFVLAGHPALALEAHDCFRAETAAQGAADVAQLAFVLAPSGATRDRATDALLEQDVRTRAALDALHRQSGTQTPLTLVR